MSSSRELFGKDPPPADPPKFDKPDEPIRCTGCKELKTNICISCDCLNKETKRPTVELCQDCVDMGKTAEEFHKSEH